MLLGSVSAVGRRTPPVGVMVAVCRQLQFRNLGVLPPPRPPPRTYRIEEAIALFQQSSVKSNDEYLHPNASYYIDIQLNIDSHPKFGWPHHKLRGLLELPHGTGRRVPVVALTTHDDLLVSAYRLGAWKAGAVEWAVTARNLERNPRQRIVVTPEVYDSLLLHPKATASTSFRKMSSIAKALRKYRRIPTMEDKTLVEPDEFLAVVKKHLRGIYSRFITNQSGHVITPLGRVGSHTPTQLVENLDCIVRHLYAIQPPDFGRHRRAKIENRGRYMVDIHLQLVPKHPILGRVPIDLPSLLSNVDDPNLYRPAVSAVLQHMNDNEREFFDATNT